MRDPRVQIIQEAGPKEGEGEEEKEENMEQEEDGEEEEDDKSVRKRPTQGGGSPTLKKKKRRKEEGGQLLKALLSSPSMTADKVEEKMAAELDSLTQVSAPLFCPPPELLFTLAPQILHEERPLLEALLVHSHWNHDKLLRQYLQNSTIIIKEAGLGGGDAAEPPSADSQVTCPACLKQKGVAESSWLWCNHVCCKVCSSSLILIVSCLSLCVVDLLGETPEDGTGGRQSSLFYLYR